MTMRFCKKFLYRSKSVRGKNSVKNLWSYLDLAMERSEQPWNIQVNIDTGDGRLFRINNVSYDRYDGSVHLRIDLSKPMGYPEFWETRGRKPRLKKKESEKEEGNVTELAD